MITQASSLTKESRKWVVMRLEGPMWRANPHCPSCSSERFKQPFQFQRKPKLIKMDLRLQQQWWWALGFQLDHVLVVQIMGINLQTSFTSAFTQRNTNCDLPWQTQFLEPNKQMVAFMSLGIPPTSRSMSSFAKFMWTADFLMPCNDQITNRKGRATSWLMAF